MEIVIKKIIILIVFINMYSWGAIKECTPKTILVNLLNSNATWIINKKGNFPFDTLHIEDGLIKIKKDNSDYHTIFFSINMDSTGEVGIFMYGGLPFDSNTQQQYFDNVFLLVPNEHSCSLEKLLFKMKKYDTYDSSKKRYIFQKIKYEGE